jgi:hypothetical protein
MNNIPTDILRYNVSEYLDGLGMFRLGLTSSSFNLIYNEYEMGERKKCVNHIKHGLKYVYERDILSAQEKNNILERLSSNTGKTVQYLEKKLLNLILSRKEGKKLHYNYFYLSGYFSPVMNSKWLFKYATDELLSYIYFLDLAGYQEFVDKSKNHFKIGKKKTDDRISRFLVEIDLNSYIIENNPFSWWTSAFKHCMLRINHELVNNLINKMHLFDIYPSALYEDVLEIVRIIVSYEPTEDRIIYLSYFNFDKNSLLFAIHETHAYMEIYASDGYQSWLSYIIDRKEEFGFNDEDFKRENLEDRLLPYDFVDVVVEEYQLLLQASFL